MSLLKIAYSLAQLSKGVKSLRANGKLVTRHLDKVYDPDSRTKKIVTTKAFGGGPSAFNVHHKDVSRNVLGMKLDAQNIGVGVYAKGQSVNLMNDAHRMYQLENGRGLPSKSLSPETKKAVNTLVLRHESDEIRAISEAKKHFKAMHGKTALNSFFGDSGHAAPSVLLREGNNVAKLGNGRHGQEVYKKAKQIMIDARKYVGDDNRIKNMLESFKAPVSSNKVFHNKNNRLKPSSEPTYVYGKTRMSRHAIHAIDRASMRQAHTEIEI